MGVKTAIRKCADCERPARARGKRCERCTKRVQRKRKAKAKTATFQDSIAELEMQNVAAMSETAFNGTWWTAAKKILWWDKKHAKRRGKLTT